MYMRAIHVHLTTTRDRSVTLDVNVWKAAHDLALDHGWQPMGASPPPGWHGFRDQGEWLGNYVWPDKQWVCGQDADNLADALVRALEAGTADLGVDAPGPKVDRGSTPPGRSDDDGCAVGGGDGEGWPSAPWAALAMAVFLLRRNRRSKTGQLPAVGQ